MIVMAKYSNNIDCFVCNSLLSPDIYTEVAVQYDECCNLHTNVGLQYGQHMVKTNRILEYRIWNNNKYWKYGILTKLDMQPNWILGYELLIKRDTSSKLNN